MFTLDDKIDDTIKDDISVLIKAMSDIPSWVKEKHKLHQELISLLKKKKYMQFVGHTRSYHLTGIGDSCLYQVPLNRRGKLSVFRGKLIRVICISSGRYDRELMAGVVKHI
jgi:hypothetical protein